MFYKIPQELAQSIASYLADRPYREVYVLIDALRALPQIKDEGKKPKIVEDEKVKGTIGD
jgi:hypothetical protein